MMKFKVSIGMTVVFALCFTATAFGGDRVAPAPNGIAFPEDYKDWRVIAVSHRGDNNSLRVILGNDAAIDAARRGQTNPWPDGSTLGKVVWKDAVDPNWEKATVPGELSHVEFMMKDTEKYAETKGWGFSRWMGESLTPYGADAGFVQECIGCHTPVRDKDYVFTHPAVMP